MLSSKSRCSTKSPIGTVPYDVLLEIFAHCLPRDRLKVNERRARVGVAPMLLCHVCSSWRTVALATRTLWTHLSCYLEGWHDEDRTRKSLENKFELIQWWKKNHGSIAPFLRLKIDIRDYDSAAKLRDITAFVMSYATTAQYLEIGLLGRRDEEEEVKAMAALTVGDDVMYANLHTLVTDRWCTAINHHFHHTSSAIRRLAILDDHGCLFSPTSIPAQWSTTLTHLSITTDVIFFDFWLTLTMNVPCLQWAYLSFDLLYYAIGHDFTTVTRTLPQLSAFFIRYTGYKLLSPLFDGLHFPALTDFFLTSTLEWWDDEGIAQIHAMLRSTPTIRNLTLRSCDFLSSDEMEYVELMDYFDDDIKPLWRLVPHLVHLQLEMYITSGGSNIEVEQALDKFARQSFFSSDNRWLGLDNPACPIKKITVIDHGSESFSTSYYYEHSAIYGRRKASIIRKCATNTFDIPLHLISEPFTDFGHSWKEWC